MMLTGTLLKKDFSKFSIIYSRTAPKNFSLQINFTQTRKIGAWETFKAIFDPKTKEIFAKQPPLEKAIIQKAALESVLEGKLGIIGKLARPLIRPKRSKENAVALVIAEKICAHASKGEWKGSSLPNDFSAWCRICFLYLWLIEVRFRYLSDFRARRRILQRVVDFLWEDIEMGIVDTLGSSNPVLLSRYSKLYMRTWFGAALSYDVGMLKSDASLTDALWRNLYASNPEVTLHELSLLVEYIRSEQHRLMQEPDSVILNADMEFSPPPFDVPEIEKVTPTLPKLHRKHKNDPIAAMVRQQYELLLQKEQIEKIKQQREINQKEKENENLKNLQSDDSPKKENISDQ